MVLLVEAGGRLALGLGHTLLVAGPEVAKLSADDDERLAAVAVADRWAVTASTNKALRCYDLEANALASVGVAPRRPSALALGGLPQGGLAAAFSCGGDLWALPVPRLEDATPVFCLGHTTSVITHVAFPPERADVVVTSDRNEKIRVSKWPQATVIECFCLGHTSFVSRVAFVGAERLVSCGGDGTVRLWEAGREVACASCGEGVVCACLAVGDSRLAVGDAERPVARVYDHALGLVSTLALPAHPIDLVFRGGSSLLVLVADATVVLCEFAAEACDAKSGGAADLAPGAVALVRTAKSLGLRPPATALHALDERHKTAEDEDDDCPSILRKHTLDRRIDVATLGQPAATKARRVDGSGGGGDGDASSFSYRQACYFVPGSIDRSIDRGVRSA